MRICFIADVRSPIARDWISYFASRHEVHVLSTFWVEPNAIPGSEVHSLVQSSPPSPKHLRTLPWSAEIHDGLAQPAKAHWLAGRARRWVDRIRPDLLHSLRLPIEGYVGAATRFRPHVISAWGNDFTLYADRFWLHQKAARAAVRQCDGFLADAAADLERAARYGLTSQPTELVPGAGGVRPELFFPGSEPASPLVVNPRGFRRYVRNDTFWAACRLVARRIPEVRFTGVAMRGWSKIEKLVEECGLSERTTLTGSMSRPDLAALYRRATISVSPTEHDGTPNTLLESMASGCLPVCGDLPSLREWIRDGENGLLCRVDRPEPLADAILRGLEDKELRQRARSRNQEIIRERADYATSMRRAEEFYARICA